MSFQHDSEIYQTATMGALLHGVYDGDTSVRELLQHGDFGLGTFNALDGEMVMVDGQCYHLGADGSAAPAALDELLPFAAVTRFRPHRTVTIDTAGDRTEVSAVIDEAAGSTNRMVALRITGEFSVVHTRAVTRQHQPYPKFTDATHDEKHSTFADVRGELLGFRMPAWVQGISVAGYHLHFLDGDRLRGGHAFDYRLSRGVVDLSICSDLHLRLPDSPEFDDADLDTGDADDEIRRTEGN